MQDGIAGPNTLFIARSYLSYSGITNGNAQYCNVGLDGVRFLYWTYGTGNWLVKSQTANQYVQMQAGPGYATTYWYQNCQSG